MSNFNLMIKKIDNIINSIDSIWDNINLSEFKKGNEELVELISHIESNIGVFSENTAIFNDMIFNLNNIMKAMEKKDYVLEADILKYELKDIFIEYKKTLAMN